MGLRQVFPVQTNRTFFGNCFSPGSKELPTKSIYRQDAKHAKKNTHFLEENKKLENIKNIFQEFRFSV
jgi:hypothetical protein